MTKWEVGKLGDVCEFFNGQAHEKCIDENGKYKVINSKFISSEGLIYKKTNIALSPLVKNDIVLCMSDVPNGKTIAKCFLVDKNDTYTLNQRICVIRSTLFDAKFLYYQLNRNKYFLSFDNGENQTNLRKDDILNCGLLIPPLSEQQHIVAILDEVFDGIAKAKANAEQNLKNAQELFESYLQSVFETKGEGWEEKRLGEISKINYGYTEKASFEEIGPKFLRITDIQDNNVAWETVPYCKCKQSDLPKYKLETGDIVFARTGATTGKSYLLDNPPESIFASYLIRLKLISKKDFIPEFVAYYFQTKTYWDKINAGISGSAQGGFNASKLGELIFSFPETLKDQQTIVQKLDALSLETKKLETIYCTKIADLEELKKSILHKAFNGELK